MAIKIDVSGARQLQVQGDHLVGDITIKITGGAILGSMQVSVPVSHRTLRDGADVEALEKLLADVAELAATITAKKAEIISRQ